MRARLRVLPRSVLVLTTVRQLVPIASVIRGQYSRKHMSLKDSPLTYHAFHVLLDLRRLGTRTSLPWCNQTIFGDVFPEDIELPIDVTVD